jgi:hypothetical protein
MITVKEALEISGKIFLKVDRQMPLPADVSTEFPSLLP